MIKLNLLRKFWDKSYLSFTEKLAAAIYIIFIFRLHFSLRIQHQIFDFQNVMILLLGFVSIILLARMLSLLTRRIHWLHIICNLLFLVVYLVICFYHLRAGVYVDYSVIADNINLLFYKESGDVILDIFKKKDKYQTIFIIITLVLLQWRYGKLGNLIEYTKRKTHMVIVGISYLILLISIPYTYEEYSSFFKTVIQYYRSEKLITIPHEKFPYVRFIDNSYVKKQPHLFIITVESFNANAVLSKASNGKEYTPFYNGLTKQGLFLENFYGHSIQTAKGQFSIYCSLLPLTKKKVFVDYPDIGLKCLPHVLKRNGYSTFFFKAYSNINYDNTFNFAKKMGFEHVYGMDSSFISKEEKEKYYWGWGIQDDLFYKKFFEYLDKNRGKKIFAALTTVSNHMKFKRVPLDQRYIYPNKNDKHHRYANSIRVSDEYLKTFFTELRKRKYLRDSIVIVTGDHSYPWGEHGVYSSENGCYDESFKTPLVLLGLDVEKKILKDRYSQVDIAPTILDSLGIDSKVPFQGKSIFKKERNPIHLIQPYDGVYLGVIVGKYKYVYHKRTNREFCYDLDIDPLEGDNIIGEMRDSLSYQSFKKGIDDIALNDYLIMNDRIWEKK